MASKDSTFGKNLKLVATIVGLLVLMSSLIAGVMDTKVRVDVLDRDTQKLEECLLEHVSKAGSKLDEIREGIHEIDKKQTAQGVQLREVINRLDRENP